MPTPAAIPQTAPAPSEVGHPRERDGAQDGTAGPRDGAGEGGALVEAPPSQVADGIFKEPQPAAAQHGLSSAMEGPELKDRTLRADAGNGAAPAPADANLRILAWTFLPRVLAVSRYDLMCRDRSEPLVPFVGSRVLAPKA